MEPRLGISCSMTQALGYQYPLLHLFYHQHKLINKHKKRLEHLLSKLCYHKHTIRQLLLCHLACITHSFNSPMFNSKIKLLNQTTLLQIIITQRHNSLDSHRDRVRDHCNNNVLHLEMTWLEQWRILKISKWLPRLVRELTELCGALFTHLLRSNMPLKWFQKA